MDLIKQKLSSRKFWAAFLGALMPICLAYLGEDIALWDAVQASSAIVIAYVLGQGYTDAHAKLT
jgi:hypothetical protein